MKKGISLAKAGHNIGKNESSIHIIKQKEAEICGSVSAAATIAKMVSLLCDGGLEKTEATSQKHAPADGKIMSEKHLASMSTTVRGLHRAGERSVRLVRDGCPAV